MFSPLLKEKKGRNNILLRELLLSYHNVSWSPGLAVSLPAELFPQTRKAPNTMVLMSECEVFLLKA